MKTKILLAFFFLISAGPSIAQEVIIKGTLRCMNNGIATSTRGAINIVIIPSFNPAASVATTTDPQGFFQINTGWKAGDLKDKEVTLYIITKCSSCKKLQRVFISEDLDKRNTDLTKLFVTVKNWKVMEDCEKIELPDIVSEQLLDSAHHLPAQDISGKAPGSQAMAPASFLNLFTKLAKLAVVQQNGLFKVTAIQPGDIRYGEFLHASAMTNTNNTGFNFSPSRNLSEAVYWNASAIANSSQRNNVSFLANFKNNFKLSGYQQITPEFYIGLGGIYTKQDQISQLQVVGIGPGNEGQFLDGINHPEKLQEFAAFVAPVYKINDRASVGLTVKSIWQQFNNPDLVSIESEGSGDNTVYNFFRDDSIRKQSLDVDLSFTYKITNFLQAGISVMNLGGTKLYAGTFVPNSSNQSYINQRAYGLGLCYKRGRLNVGADLLMTDKDLYDVSLGANYVPFNNALIAGGYAFKQQSFSISFGLKNFKIAYIYDNGLLINDLIRSKSKIFNGKIYTGFVFDF